MSANKIIRSLYKGEITIEFYPDSHRYKKAGEKKYLTSVTAITGVYDKSRVLIDWAIRLAREHFSSWLNTQDNAEVVKAQVEEVFSAALIQHTIKKDEAASIGDQVHAFAEAFALAQINGTVNPAIPEEAPETVINGITAFLQWVNENKVEFLESEVLLYSKEYDYVGKSDLIARVNSKKKLLDYKTAKGVYPDHRWQAAGYRHAYEEERGEALEGLDILHFNKETGEFVAHEYSDEEYQKDFQAFLGCLAVKKRAKELDEIWRAEQKELATVN